MAQSVLSGCKTEKILSVTADEVNRILDSRMGIDSKTGLNEKEFMIVQKVVQRGRLSTTAVANLLKTTKKDAMAHYIEPLRASEWLAVSSQGVIPGFRTHENYRLFVKRLGE